jgi:hypothetical protein
MKVALAVRVSYHGGEGEGGVFSGLAPDAGIWPSMRMRPDIETCGGCEVFMIFTVPHMTERYRMAGDAERFGALCV